MSTDSSSVILPYTLKINRKRKSLALIGLLLLWSLDVVIFFSSNKTRVSGIELITFFAIFYSAYVPYVLSRRVVLDDDCIRYKAVFDEEMQISYENIKQIKIQQISMYSGMYFRIELFDYPHKIQLKKNSKFINIFFIGKDEWRKFLKVVVEKNPKVLLDSSSKLMLEGKY
jgi:hypothetical protein